MKKTIKTKFLLIGLLSAILVVLLACAVPKAAEPTPTTAPKVKAPIKITVLGDLSGPYAAILKPWSNGMADTVKLYNSKGGLDGHQVNLTFLDHSNDVKKALGLYSSMVTGSDKPLIYIGVSSTVDMALKEKIAEDQIVEVTTGAASPAFVPVGWIFGYAPPYASMMGGFTDWMLKDWKTSATHDGPPRLAYLAWDIAFGKACDTSETQAYLKSKGVEVVAREWTPVAPVSVSENMLRIRDAKADWVVSFVQSQYNSVVFRDAFNLSMTPPNVRYAAIYTGVDALLYSLVPKETEVIKPVSIGAFQNFFDKNDTLVQKYEEMFTQNNRTQTDRSAYCGSGRALGVAVSMMQEALKTTEFDKLNGAAVYKAAQTMNGVDVDKPVFGVSGYVVSYSSTKRAPDKMYLGQAGSQAQGILPITSWFDAPDLLPGGKDVPK